MATLVRFGRASKQEFVTRPLHYALSVPSDLRDSATVTGHLSDHRLILHAAPRLKSHKMPYINRQASEHGDQPNDTVGCRFMMVDWRLGVRARFAPADGGQVYKTYCNWGGRSLYRCLS